MDISEYIEKLPQLLRHAFTITGSHLSAEQLRTQLAGQINHLIQYDFNKLVSILYRLDVSETKLKNTLRDHPDTDAGALIADMIIERQVQKIKTRQQYGKQQDNIPEDEKW